MSVDTTENPSPEAATPPDETGSAVPEQAESFEPPGDPQPSEDIDRILPAPGEPFDLADGTIVVANPLRLKEFLGLLKIVTRGAAMALGQVRLNTNDEDFMQSMMSLFLFAIPEAEDEAADFLRMMIKPYGPFPSIEDEQIARAELDVKMANPDLEDMFTIIEVVINSEGKDLRRLGKRLSKALEFATKTGQI